MHEDHPHIKHYERVLSERIGRAIGRTVAPGTRLARVLDEVGNWSYRRTAFVAWLCGLPVIFVVIYFTGIAPENGGGSGVAGGISAVVAWSVCAWPLTAFVRNILDDTSDEKSDAATE